MHAEIQDVNPIQHVKGGKNHSGNGKGTSANDSKLKRFPFSRSLTSPAHNTTSAHSGQDINIKRYKRLPLRSVRHAQSPINKACQSLTHHYGICKEINGIVNSALPTCSDSRYRFADASTVTSKVSMAGRSRKAITLRGDLSAEAVWRARGALIEREEWVPSLRSLSLGLTYTHQHTGAGLLSAIHWQGTGRGTNIR